MSKIVNRANDIAIIGMAGRFPGANNLSEYWSNIRNKCNSITEFGLEELIDAGVQKADVKHPNYVRCKGYLEGANLFDADFFKFSKYEAEQLDPQYRIFLEESWHAFEDAGYIPEKLQGKIGVFAGSSNIDSYYFNNLLKNSKSSLSPDNFTTLLFNSRDFLSNLVAYKLNLKGPAVTVQTACSTSLVSIAMACQSLLCFDVDMAIAGGVCVTTPLKAGYLFQEGMMLSPSGKCSSFSQNADGIVLGNGCGIIVLKRLNEAITDNDHIYAVIKGYAVNHDGSNKIGFTAPGVSGQTDVLRMALKKSGLKTKDISYIEAHGTGTVLGDLIEFESLKEVYRNNSCGTIALGTVKPNIGHLDAASGVSGLIKTVLALQNKEIPPNINFTQPNESLNFSKSPFYVNVECKPWETSHVPRYAGVSSFGMGGTNAHFILSEAPKKSITKMTCKNEVICLSARTEDSLRMMEKSLASFLSVHRNFNLSDVAFTLQFGRKQFQFRSAFVCKTIDDAISQLKNNKGNLNHVVGDEKYSIELREWLNGGNIDFNAFSDLMNTKCRLSLPGYIFDRRKYWSSQSEFKFLGHRTVASASSGMSLSRKKEDIKSVELKIKKIFEKFLFKKNIDTDIGFEELGGESFSALLIMHEINKTLRLKVPISIFDKNLSVRILSYVISSHIENQERDGF